MQFWDVGGLGGREQRHILSSSLVLMAYVQYIVTLVYWNLKRIILSVFGIREGASTSCTYHILHDFTEYKAELNFPP